MRKETETNTEMEVKMRRLLEGIIVSVLMVEIGSVACAANGAGTLYAGTAKVDISPDQPVISAAGMSFRLPDTLPEEKTPPTNLHDPLYARIVVFKSGETALAIVSLDLQFFSSEKLIAEAKEKWKVDHVILSSSHTHSGMVPRAICPTKGGWAWAFVPSDPREKVDWPGLSKENRHSVPGRRWRMILGSSRARIERSSRSGVQRPLWRSAAGMFSSWVTMRRNCRPTSRAVSALPGMRR